MDHLWGVQVFSRIDLGLEYWKIPVYNEDLPKTTFRIHWGSYEFLVMLFGVTNAVDIRGAPFTNTITFVIETNTKRQVPSPKSRATKRRP